MLPSKPSILDALGHIDLKNCTNYIGLLKRRRRQIGGVALDNVVNLGLGLGFQFFDGI